MNLLRHKAISKVSTILGWFVIFTIVLITACFQVLEIIVEKTPAVHKMDVIIVMFCTLFALFTVLLIKILLPIVRQLENDSNELRKLASIDPLTGLYNRRAFNQAFEKQVALLERGQCQDAILVLVDLDDFKLINDKHGHDVGDDVIRRVAQVLLEKSRITDVIGRFGGEEFMLLLPNTRPDDAHVVCEKIRKAICDIEIPHESTSLKITASFGMTPINETMTFTLHLKLADEALYQAKEQGKNTIKYQES